jgi:hypothetical protein
MPWGGQPQQRIDRGSQLITQPPPHLAAAGRRKQQADQ